MDLLNDFETNFDRALLSVGQTGGEDTAPPASHPAEFPPGESAVDGMLMQELEEARNRLQRLESLNSALVNRSSQLEASERDRKKERDDTMQKLSHMDLELRMSKMGKQFFATETDSMSILFPCLSQPDNLFGSPSILSRGGARKTCHGRKGSQLRRNADGNRPRYEIIHES